MYLLLEYTINCHECRTKKQMIKDAEALVVTHHARTRVSVVDVLCPDARDEWPVRHQESQACA